MADLSSKLRDRIKKATSHVATKIEAEKGDFKVVVSEQSIDFLYKGIPAGKIAIATLGQSEIEDIDKNPQDFAQKALEDFSSIDSVSLAEFEKSNVKTAANAALDAGIAYTTTEKQLSENKVELHPRKDEFPNTITQKQLPEAGKRPGTYGVTTEAQLEEEKSTFYGESRTAGWQDESRPNITEKQLDEGVGTFSDFATNDRNDMGAKFDGGPDKQALMVGEKQLAELLKHHEWKEPVTVTESQLKEQKGELARLTAEIATQIIKESMSAFGKTVLAAGSTPDEIVDVVKKLVSHPSKYPVLASVIMNYACSDCAVIDKKVAKSQYFGKVANSNNNYSDNLIADIIVRQLAKSANDPRHIVEGLVSLTEDANFANRIHEASEEIIKNTSPTIKEASNISVFKTVLSEENKPQIMGDDDDGLYEYNGAISEIKANVNDREAFVKEATVVAEREILKAANKTLKLQADKINVDEDSGTFSMVFINPEIASKANLEARASKRREMSKEAQVPSGGMAPPAGGMGAGSNPTMPPAGGDMGAAPAAPPVESLSQPTPPENPEEEGKTGGEAKPPGSICGLCGSEDVDLDNGNLTCNECGGKGEVSFNTKWTTVPNVLEDTDKGSKQDEGFGLGEGLGTEEAGGEPEAGTTMPNVPVAASYKLTPLVIEKLASNKIEFGTVCPGCGSHNTDLVKASQGKNGLCWDCFGEYNVQVQVNPKKKHEVVAEIKWTAMHKESCTTCSRAKTAFVQSLKDYGMSWDQFKDLGTMSEQAEVILKMAKAGVLKTKIAQSNANMVKYAASTRWNGYEQFDKFPDATCRERLNRKFGENATAMSGPCKGAQLADCVCKQLDSLGIYTDGLAAKVASRLSDPNPMVNNPMETCIGMFVREGHSVSDACTVCEGLRSAYANDEDLVVEAAISATPMAARPVAPAPAAPQQGFSAPAPAAPAAPSPAAPAPVAKKPVAPAPKAMEGNPLDEPVSDSIDAPELPAEISDIQDIDDAQFGGDDLAKNPAELAEPVEAPAKDQDMVNILVDGLQDIVNALKGQFQVEPGPAGVGFGDDSLDMSDISEDTVAPHDEAIETPAEEAAETPEMQEEEAELGVEEHSPEVTHDEAIETPAEEAAETPEVQEEEREEGKEEHGIPGLESKDDEPLEKSSEPEEEKEAQSLDHVLFAMKNKTIKRSADALDSVYESLMRQAMKMAAKNDEVKKVEYKNAKEKKVSVKPAQDSSEIGKIKDGGKLGAEEAFSKGVKTKPDVPRAKGTLGEEGDEMTVNETGDMPSVAVGADKMEGEDNFKAEKEVNVDGNQGGRKL